MSEYVKHIITANNVMIDYNKNQIKLLKAEQSSLPKKHARRVRLSAIIRKLNADISKRKKISANAIAEQ